MGPGTEAAIDGAVTIKEHGGEGEIVIELEKGEVERIGVDEADADELIEERFEIGFGEDAGIDAGAGETGNTAEDDEEGFAGGFGALEAELPIVVNPAFVVFHFGAVAQDGADAVLHRFGGRGEHEGQSERRDEELCFHGNG